METGHIPYIFADSSPFNVLNKGKVNPKDHKIVPLHRHSLSRQTFPMLQSRVILPSAPLRHIIHHFWVMKGDAFRQEMYVMPRGCSKWMFHRTEPFMVNGMEDITKTASVCGQYHTATRISSEHPCNLIFVFFHPYAIKMVMGGIPGDQFYEENIDMDSLGIPEFKDLKHKVLNAPDNIHAIALIEDFVMRQVSQHSDTVYLPRLQYVCHAIKQQPLLSSADLAEMACLSERQFRRVFSEFVGISPKRLLKVERFLEATRSIQCLKDHDFTNIVYGMGYTDHSHFNKDFKEFAGMSPTEYLNHVKRLRETNVLEGYKTYHL